MQITWYGQSLFQITTSPEKNIQVRIIIDPFDKSIGLRVPKLEADILLISRQHPDYNNAGAVSGIPSARLETDSSARSKLNPFVIEGPGEYEVKNIFIQGILNFHDKNQGKEKNINTIYTIGSENIKLCHLGSFGQKELTEEQLEKIGEVDILMIPIGGNPTLSAKEAAKIMSQLEPKITIPMHYAIPKLKVKLDSLDEFLKIFGIKSLSPINKFSIKKKDILTEEAKIIVLKK
jgi:L-ascorbate metabolism protein UlaG (beta-lactamase superfamily)